MEELTEQLNEKIKNNAMSVLGNYGYFYSGSALQAQAAMTLTSEAMRQLSEIVQILGCADIDHLRELVQAEKDGQIVVCPCKKGDVLWSYYNHPSAGIYEITVISVSVIDGVTAINTDRCGVIAERDIGSTVFRTPEEAAAALERRQKKSEGSK